MFDVVFHGDPPFSLPAAESAVASPRNGAVIATFAVAVPSQAPFPAPVEIAMTPSVAEFLAIQLLEAAAAT
jgi:hypothetical protein